MFAGIGDGGPVTGFLAFYLCPGLCLFGPLVLITFMAIRYRKREPGSK